MVNCQQLRGKFDDLESQFVNKYPRHGRCGFYATLAGIFIIIFVLGLGIGLGVRPGRKNTTSNDDTLPLPNYIYITNNIQTCPELSAEYLLTNVTKEQSFEGYVVNLACKRNHIPFPRSVQCRRKDPLDAASALEWSHLPVCYPGHLLTTKHWEVTPHAKSVTCSGGPNSTQCQLNCVREYRAVETSPYQCTDQPCARWTLQDSHCYMCDKKCDAMHKLHKPDPKTLLKSLNLSGCYCDQIIVSSDGQAAIHQSTRIGLFHFYGEHAGLPVYWKRATKEYLFYTKTPSGFQWLVGPDFQKPHAGIKVYANDSLPMCPEHYNGRNISMEYVDYSKPATNESWTKDETLSFNCFTADAFKPVTCGCKKYKVSNTTYEEGKKVPYTVTYLSGDYELDSEQGSNYGLLAPFYVNREKDLYLFSHHFKGMVWEISSRVRGLPPLRGHNFTADAHKDCPDADLKWEIYNSTSTESQHVYIEDNHIKVECTEPMGGTDFAQTSL